MTVETDAVGQRLLDAADVLLATGGPEALTVRNIAERAGMSTMNVYSRFGNKFGVVDRLFLEGYQRLTTAMEAVPVTDDPAADLAECGHAYRRFALANRAHYMVCMENVFPEFTPSVEAATVGLTAMDHLVGRVQRCMDDGAFVKGDAAATAALVWSVVHGCVSLEMKPMALVIDWDEIFENAVRLVEKGLRSQK